MDKYMQRQKIYKMVFSVLALGLFFCPIALLLLPQDAVGTSDYMVVLPAFERFQCKNCHIMIAPTLQSHELNLFGQDFKANGYIWDPTLATKNSDRDRCANGFELGDSDGDGVLDQQSKTTEHSNPGDPSDCSIAVNEQTWGIIKELFSRETSVPLPIRFP